MSTNSECDFLEVEPGKWYYFLEDTYAPKNSWDWREHAQAYGPFGSFKEADEHLGWNHPNPGGFTEMPYSPEYKLSEIERKLIANATK